jgi:hypothetical protein
VIFNFFPISQRIAHKPNYGYTPRKWELRTRASSLWNGTPNGLSSLATDGKRM